MSECVGTTFPTAFNTPDEDGRYIVAKVGIVLHSLGPERDMDGCRPSVGSMKESCAGALCDVPYATFSLPILVMCVDAAEREGLMSE